MLAIPEASVDAFLVDLRLYLEMVRPMKQLLDSMVEAYTEGQIKEAVDLPTSFRWIDDGKHDQTYRIKAGETETKIAFVVNDEGAV